MENETDSYLRYILSTMRNMEYLSLKNIENLKKIDFVKFMPNLIELDISGTGVEDLSILENLTTDGNLQKFASLGISNEQTDLTKIQTTINSMYKRNGTYWTQIGDVVDKPGLKLYSDSLIEKLNKCQNIVTLRLNTYDRK